ncbi:MAG: hypothetical protein EHM47_16925 [Ignavibacteriales bacterium]|nr:MAG: hypothetical protein EHM47_16925 [Ignavibacteriales bacterium]
MKNKFNLLFFFTALLISIFLIQFTILNIDGNIPLYIFIYFEIFLLFLLGFYLVKKKAVNFRFTDDLTKKIGTYLNTEKNLSVPLFIIFSGLLFRIILFPAELTTSPDAYRYIWEGKVIINGYNPYEYEPGSDALRHLHSKDLPAKINFKEKKAIYPPAAQFVFAAAYLISGENLWGLKLIYFIFEIITMIFLLKLLLLKNKDPNLVILYSWLPLPVMEYFVNAHLDVFGISFFIMSVYFFENNKFIKASIFFAISILSKFFPLFVLPLLFKKYGLKRTFLTGMIILIISAIFYLPFYSSKVNVFSFLLLYLERWEFNASIYYFLKLLVSNEVSRIICAALFLILIIIISYRYKDFTKAALGILTAFIIFASTVYPWYLGWIAVLNPLYGFYSLTSLMFTSNLSNITPMSPVWTEYTYVLLAEYITFFILLAVDFRREKTFLNSV